MLFGSLGLLALIASHAEAQAACAWRSGEVLEVSGEVRVGGLAGRLMRRTEIGSGRFLETDDLGIIVTRDGFDGGLAWSQDMSGGVHDLNSDFARRLAISAAWLDARQGCPPSDRNHMTRLGSRRDHERRFVAWRAAPPGGTPFELWYDARTGRLDRAFFQTAETRLIRHFADWRDIGGGLLVAFEQRDEFPEDEDETVRRITHAFVRRAATAKDFVRPQPPKDASILGGAQSTLVPFEDDHRTRIFIPVTLNGKGPFLFELDNGGHDILTAETAEAVGLTGKGSFSSTGAGNAVAQSGIARVARIQIGNAVLRDQPVQIRAFSAASNDRSPNPPRAGILGLELFERFIVAIDPLAKTVTLRAFGSGQEPAGTSLPLKFTEDAPLIAGSYKGLSGDFMLDTGNAGPTIIEDYWAQKLGLAADLKRGAPRGDTKVSKGLIGLGSFRLSNELISYYGAAERGSEYSRAVAGVYGEPLLSRFRSVYDYSKGKVWFDPLAAVPAVPFDRSGLALGKAEAGTFKVSAVMSNSPADLAGIRVGDLIETIQKIPARTLSRADAADILRQKAGTAIALTGKFGGVDGSKTFALRELLEL